MVNGQDGGRWALAGFLYQIVGMLSMVARASQPAEFSRKNGGDEVDSLLTLPDVQTHHERFEDAAFISVDDECVLVQFKYSSTGRKIGIGEAREIIEKLSAGVGQATNQGYRVTACVLFTNRELTSRGGKAARQHWESEKQERPYDLRYYKSAPIESLIEDLNNFGREYGLFGNEIEEGIDRMIGRVLLRTGDLFDRSFDQSNFIGCLVGSDRARRLTAARICEQPHQRLEDFGNWIGINQWDSYPIQRARLHDVIEAINENRALIGLCGQGGCGKSILIWQVLTNLPPDRCCTFVHAEEVLGSWIENTVHNWRGLVGNSGDTREEAVERLLIANPDSPRPVLWLGLDGIDEGDLSPARQNHIRKILRWFWRSDLDRMNDRPPAILIVSSRKEEKLRDFLRLEGGPLQPTTLPLTLKIDVFTDQERDMAASQKVPGIHQRVHQTLSRGRLREWSDSIEVWGAEAPDENLDSIDAAVWDSLRHPAMWQALLSLDRETQRRAIEGVSDARSQLAHGFLQWFGHKLRMRRGQQTEDLTSNDYHGLFEVLEAIARHSDLETLKQRDPDWVEPARQTPIGISRREAEDLYRESLSAGLIIEENESRTWRWRHSLVYDYLVNYPEGDQQDG
jgi:hypothetical protein